MNSSTFNSDKADSAQAHFTLQNLSPLLLIAVVATAIECFAYLCLGTVQNERIIIPKPHRHPNLAETIIQAKVDSVIQGRRKVDLIVLGDSSGLMGVDSRLLAQQTGRTNYNLCTIGYVGVEGHVLLLEAYIAKHGVPSAVIYHFAPRVMPYTHTYLERIGWLSRLKGALNIEDPSYVLPSQRYRDIARRLIVPEGIYDDVPRGRWPSHSETLKILANNDGYMPEIGISDWKASPIVSGTVSSFQRQSLRRLVELSRRLGFKLYLIANPLPLIARTSANLAAMQTLETEIANIAQDNRQASLYRPFSRFYADEQVVTANHLHPDAVPKNTATISEWISMEE